MFFIKNYGAIFLFLILFKVQILYPMENVKNLQYVTTLYSDGEKNLITKLIGTVNNGIFFRNSNGTYGVIQISTSQVKPYYLSGVSDYSNKYKILCNSNNNRYSLIYDDHESLTLYNNTSGKREKVVPHHLYTKGTQYAVNNTGQWMLVFSDQFQPLYIDTDKLKNSLQKNTIGNISLVIYARLKGAFKRIDTNEIVKVAAFCNKGTMHAYGCEDGSIIICQAIRKDSEPFLLEKYPIKNKKKSITDIKFSLDDEYLFYTADKELFMRTTKTLSLMHTIEYATPIQSFLIGEKKGSFSFLAILSHVIKDDKKTNMIEIYNYKNEDDIMRESLLHWGMNNILGDIKIIF